jgi:hypothetical protein
MLLPLVLASASITSVVHRLPTSQTQSSQPQPSQPKPTATAEPRWTWTKGQTTRYLVTQDVESRSEGMLNAFVSQHQEQRIVLSVADVSATGDATLDLTLDSISLSIVTAEGVPPLMVSSKAKPSDEEFDPSSQCRAMEGLTLSLVVSPSGELREIRGLEAFQTRVRRVFAEPATVAAITSDVLSTLSEDRLRTVLQPALLLAAESTARPATPAKPVAIKGLGSMVARTARATSSSSGLVIAHQTTDFTLASPNEDEISKTFEVALTDAREECESTFEPATGTMRKVTSTLRLSTTFKPRATTPGLSTTTRTTSQTLTIEPETKENAASTPPAAPGTP